MLRSLLPYLACSAIALLITSAAYAAEVISSPAAVSAHIRTLAASCAACHGTNGNSLLSASIESTPSNNSEALHHLAGINPSYFVTQMTAFKSCERKATVMHHHAKGLNSDEINLLAIYFSQQKSVASISPKPQQLKAEHE